MNSASTPGVTLLEAVVGSVAYGLAGPDSDEDLLAVHLAPTEAVLGLDGARVVETSVVTTNPDRASHELGKFARLAAKANPTLIELLWAETYRVRTPAGEALVAIRDAFLSTTTVRNAYGGYVHAQLERFAKRGDGSFSAATRARSAKHARHCRRLLIQGEQLLTEGRLVLDVSAHREALTHVEMLAVHDPEWFVLATKEALVRFAELPSVLADQVDLARIDATVVEIRKAAFRD